MNDSRAKARRRGDLASVLDVNVVARDLQEREDEYGSVHTLCALAVDLLDADAVGVTAVSADRYRTIAATGSRPAEVDALQFSLGEGPTILVTTSHVTIRTGDLVGDQRWPRLGPRIFARTGLRSMLAIPVVVAGRTAAALAAYATRGDAFGEEQESIGALLGTHAALALQSAQSEDRTKQLAAVLRRNRRIGTATGILMVERRWSYSQAFEAMAFEATWRYARDQTTRIVDVADEIIRRQARSLR